jgi:hypothetical protein
MSRCTCYRVRSTVLMHGSTTRLTLKSPYSSLHCAFIGFWRNGIARNSISINRVHWLVSGMEKQCLLWRIPWNLTHHLGYLLAQVRIELAYLPFYRTVFSLDQSFKKPTSNAKVSWVILITYVMWRRRCQSRIGVWGTKLKFHSFLTL